MISRLVASVGSTNELSKLIQVTAPPSCALPPPGPCGNCTPSVAGFTACSARKAVNQLLFTYWDAATGYFKVNGVSPYWTTANTIEALANYAAATNDTLDGFLTCVVARSAALLVGSGAPGAQPIPITTENPYNDDILWWVLASLRAGAVLGDAGAVNHTGNAVALFSHLVGRPIWTADCGGGVFWCMHDQYKNTVTNTLFMSAAVGLAARVGGSGGPVIGGFTYEQWAVRVRDWFLRLHMRLPSGVLADGLHRGTCTACEPDACTPWTYNSGVILSALASPLLHNESLGGALVTSALAFFGSTDGIVKESSCATVPGGTADGWCGDNGDAPMQKGVFVRHLAYNAVALAGGNATMLEAIRSAIRAQAASILAHSSVPVPSVCGLQFGQMWQGPITPPGSVDEYPYVSLASGLEALNAAIMAGAQ